jgi:hypothetical protein
VTVALTQLGRLDGPTHNKSLDPFLEFNNSYSMLEDLCRRLGDARVKNRLGCSAITQSA